MCKKNSKIKKSNLIATGAKAVINAGGTVITTTNPSCGVAVGLITPILDAFIEELHKRHISKIEDDRICAFRKDIVSQLGSQNNTSHKTWEEVLSDEETINIGRILEAICLQLRSEPDERKLCCYSLFYVNIAQNKNIKYSYAVTLIKLFDKLSYRQLQIMRYIKEQQMVDMGQWNPMFVMHTEELASYFDFYSECANLADMRLLTQSKAHAAYNVSGLGEEILSPLGHQMLTYIDSADLSQGASDVSQTMEYLTHMTGKHKK